MQVVSLATHLIRYETILEEPTSASSGAGFTSNGKKTILITKTLYNYLTFLEFDDIS